MPVPCWTVNDKLVGLAPIAGGTGAGVTVTVTGTETGCAPDALTVIIAVWVPTPRELLTGLMVTEPFPIPEVGLSVNQAVVVVAFQFNVPPPRLLTVRSCEEESVSPC